MRRNLQAAVLTAALLAQAPLAFAPPTIVPGNQGYLGGTPGDGDRVFAPGVAISPRQTSVLEGDVVAGRALLDFPPPILPGPPEFQFFEDRLHTVLFLGLNQVGQSSSGTSFTEVDKTAPSVERALSDPDLFAAAMTYDGSSSGTMTLELALLPLDGSATPTPFIVQVPSVGIPDTFFSSVDLAMDDLDRATAVFTEFDEGVPTVKAQRVDWDAVALLEELEIDLPAVDPEVAILDPRGNRLVVTYSDLSGPPGMGGEPLWKVEARFVDTTGPSPVVGSGFPINSTAPIFSTLDPSVAADPATGAFVVAWEDVTGVSGDPANVRARRFDASGNPLGDDFVVNTTTADAQGQPATAYGTGGLFAVAWAGDDAGTASLDIYFQVFDRDGAPIGGETRANAGQPTETDWQDQPVVRFLPLPDAQGRPQLVVAWRDAGDDTGGGADPNDTGIGYRCFAIDGLEESQEIFSDGFESGDTSSWSGSVP